MSNKRGRGRPRTKVVNPALENFFKYSEDAETLPPWVKFRDIPSLWNKTCNDLTIHGVGLKNSLRNWENMSDLAELTEKEVQERYKELITICGVRKNKPFILKELNSIAGKRYLPKDEQSKKATRDCVANAINDFGAFAKAFVMGDKYPVSKLAEILVPFLNGKRFSRQTVASILKGRTKTRPPKRKKE